MLLETGRLLLVFIDNCELLHLVRRQVSSQAGFNLFKNLVSRELFRILENFHFSISISKHFDFTFHFSKKSESILISLCTSQSTAFSSTTAAGLASSQGESGRGVGDTGSYKGSSPLLPSSVVTLRVS